MDLYEVHVPCGQKVVVICKEDGEDVKILKNGKPVYKENEDDTKKNTANTGTIPSGPSVNYNTKKTNTNATSLPRLIEDGPNPTKAPDEQEEESDSTVEKPNMAGGKKSRRNNPRKNNVTRRKAQAGGKKRGPNGYMKFANKVRPQILKEHPELKSDVVGVARKIGEKWRALSDSEKAKY